MPSRYSSIMVSWVLPEQEVGVIGMNNDFVCRLMQVLPPVLEHFSQSQEFLVVYIVVVLHLIHGFGKESDRMEDIFLISLHQDGSNGII